jgi:hypothetical protein
LKRRLALAMARARKKRGAKKAAPTNGEASQPPPQHRITVEAQEGSNTIASERWDRPERAPTVKEVLEMLDRLEGKLTAREREVRQRAFAQVRAYVPQIGATPHEAPPIIRKSFPQPALPGGVRVDLNIFEGRIVP